MSTLTRLPSALYVIARITHDQEMAEQVLTALHDVGWRLVPFRSPSLTTESSLPPLVEGQISSRQLIAAAASFDEIDEDLFSAADFVSWLVPEIRNSPEAQWLEKRRLG